jgi:hypothetical protein
MSLRDTTKHLDDLVETIGKDLIKVKRGNKSATQRVRVSSVLFAKVAKRFRKESVYAEKELVGDPQSDRQKGRRKKKQSDLPPSQT